MDSQTLTVLDGETATAEVQAEEAKWRTRRGVSEASVLAASQLMQKAFGGSRAAGQRLAEALSSDDFLNASLTVLDRETIERYQDLPATWSEYCGRTTVRDFKPKKLVDLMGGRAALDLVPELSEYPERAVSKRFYQLTALKYGGRFMVSWEAIVNDELDEIRAFPDNLAAAARDTESRVAASLLTDGVGPNGAYFSATAIGQSQGVTGTQSNLLTANPVLNTDNLAAALTAISSRRDPEGRPIYVSAYVLVVPPALEIAANQIVNATEIELVQGNTRLTVGNFLRGRIKIVVEPWLAVLDTNTGSAAAGWYLLPDPNRGRPALFLAFLRGHETPDLRVKADSGNALGGGSIAPEEGSFDVDSVEWRVRHVVGGSGADMLATAASTGAGV